MAIAPLTKRLQRPIAIALLVVANLALLWAIPGTLMGLQMSGRFGAMSAEWPYLVCIGIIAGQLIWLSCWFSLSRSHLVYRLSVLLLSLIVGTLQVFLLPALFMLFPTPDWEQLRRYVADRHLIWQWVCFSVLLQVALVICFYAVLLPIRRLRGLSVGVANEQMAVDAAKRQFRIAEWMGWSLLTMLPLAILRWINIGDQFLEMLLQLATAAIGSLVLGIPMFCAGLIGRRSVAAIPVAVAYVFAIAWIYSEGTYLLGIYRSPMLEFRVAVALLAPATTMICLNNMALQLLGFRLIVQPRQPRSAVSR